MIVACLAAACLVPPPAPVPPAVPEPWASLADCESGAWAGDGTPLDGTAVWDVDAYHDGGLQFRPSTWSAFKDDHHPTYAHQATPHQQIAVAEDVLAAQGWNAWPVCSRKLGLGGDR